MVKLSVANFFGDVTDEIGLSHLNKQTLIHTTLNVYFNDCDT